MLEKIVKTGFLVSLISYLVFWGADLLQPGFVSRYLSVHMFLLSGLVFGILWAALIEEYTDRRLTQVIIAWILGVLLAIIMWNVTEDIGIERSMLTIIGLVSPIIVYGLIRK